MGGAVIVGGAALVIGGIIYAVTKSKAQAGVTPGSPGTPTVAWVPVSEISPSRQDCWAAKTAEEIVARCPRYRFSMIPGADVSARMKFVTDLTDIGFVSLRTWEPGDVPADWPADDRSPNRFRLEVVYRGTVPIPSNPNIDMHLYAAMQAAK